MAAKAKTLAPPIDAAAAVDELGRLRLQLDALHDREKLLKDAVLSAGAELVVGAVFRATITTAARWTLDMAAAKVALGEAWRDAHSKSTIVRTVKTALRLDVVEGAAAQMGAA